MDDAIMSMKEPKRFSERISVQKESSTETTTSKKKENSDENVNEIGGEFDQPLQLNLSKKNKKIDKKVQAKQASSPDPEVFIIEAFICRNSLTKRLLVKWKGFPFSAATWEPLKGLPICEEVFKLFISREKALKNLYNSLTPKPLNYYEFPTSNMRYAVTDMCYHIERYINRKIEESSFINKTPVYIVNWSDYDSVPEIVYCTSSTVGAKMISDLELDKIIEPCKNCVATKVTDNCQSMEQYFKQSDIAYEIKPVKMECSDACNCLIKPCPTTIVKQGRKIPVIIFKTLNKGWGLYAGRTIEKNEFICEYIGEIIDEADATSRNGNYIFSMDYMSGDDDSAKFHIDARKFCSEARFVNHCCNSNSEIHAVYSSYKNLDYHKVAFFAKRKIIMGEEITINYFNGILPQGEKIEYDDCLCGAHNCIKKIPKGKNDGNKH
uniref:Histone-lysine N-methyltransferase n=1 Tax=Rhabditophanes sp. KR3021 TaxID=114890 RepID=A0AC35U8T3_9BILA